MLTGMECKGSVILFDEKDEYCTRCPIKAECELEVAANRTRLEVVLSTPVFGEGGKFWAKTARATQRKRSAVKAMRVERPEISPPTAAAPVKVVKAELAKTKGPHELPKKVIEELERWRNRGVNLSLIEDGRSPFEGFGGFRMAHLITQAALSQTNPTKKEVADKFMAISLATLGRAQKESSAASNVNIILGALEARGYKLYKEKE